MHILNLPDTVLMDILELISYDEIAKTREVCKRFNFICQQVLNTGFNKIIQEHAKNFKQIKSKLPRRESERRNHFLARHSDILTSIETRISMLTMTYSKFIDLNICCFIPGRVLDEISNILKLLSSTTKQLRPHEVLQELRDISSMAIEHFDEKIAINFKLEHQNKLAESAGATRVAICGALGDISFSGVKRTTVSTKETPLRCSDSYLQQCNNILCMSQKTAAMVQQARLLSTAPPANTPTDCSKPYHSKRMNDLVKKTFKVQKILSVKVRALENARNTQDRRLQEALATITELSTQVSELKRQLEDVSGTKRTALTLDKSSNSNNNDNGNTGGVATSCAKRQAIAADNIQPIKKPKH